MRIEEMWALTKIVKGNTFTLRVGLLAYAGGRADTILHISNMVNSRVLRATAVRVNMLARCSMDDIRTKTKTGDDNEED